MKKNYLLRDRCACRLYERYAKDLPIIDFHNHLSAQDMSSNKKFNNITEIWLASDPYKHRLMRICGVPERFITGDASDFEKFEKFCEIFPGLAGNPVYDWSRMELSMIFGIEDLPSAKTAEAIYKRTEELLSKDEFSYNGILARFGVEYQSPVADLTEDLSCFSGGVSPSLRGDSLLLPTDNLKSKIEEKTGIRITDTDEYIKAVSMLLDEFDSVGCRVADHALDDGFFDGDTDGKMRDILVRLGVEYYKRGWTLLLHIGAKRKTSDRLAALAGKAGGYAAIGNSFDVSSVCDLLSDMERAGGLPSTVLFPLNLSDMPSFAVMSGSFSEDGVGGKIQLGPAWWWCDHAFGIKHALDSISAFGVLSEFLGMTTDSRSILSFVRHDYFRRILCSYISEKNSKEDLGLTEEAMGELIKKICYENAKKRIEVKK